MRRTPWWTAICFVACSSGAALPAAEPAADEILKLKEKIIDLQNAGELSYREFCFCENILNLGSYVPLAEAGPNKEGKLLIYFEPANVFTNRKDGLYEIWYTADVALLSGKDEVMQEWKEMMAFHHTGKRPVCDLYGQISIALGGQLPAGRYKIKTTLNDKLSSKTTSRVADFEVK